MIGGAAAIANFFRGHDLSDESELEARDVQELETRVIPLLVPGLAAALTGVAAGAPLIPLLNKPKREPEPETQELEARIFPLILPGLAAAAAVAPLIPGFPKPKRDISDDLFSREPEFKNELEARILPALLPAITNVLGGASSITPLIPNFVNRPKREVSDDLLGVVFSREPQTWAEVAESVADHYTKREPSQELEARFLFDLFSNLRGLTSITPLGVRPNKREPSPELESWFRVRPQLRPQ